MLLVNYQEHADMQVVGFEALACSIKRDPKRPIDKKLSCFPEGNPNGVIPDKQSVEKGRRLRLSLPSPCDLLHSEHGNRLLCSSALAVEQARPWGA